MWQFPLNAIAPCSWTPEESQVESCEHQDNANIHCQPFPESGSEEHEIYTDYDGCHRHHVKHDSYLSAHFSFLGFLFWCVITSFHQTIAVIICSSFDAFKPSRRPRK